MSLRMQRERRCLGPRQGASARCRGCGNGPGRRPPCLPPPSSADAADADLVPVQRDERPILGVAPSWTPLPWMTTSQGRSPIAIRTVSAECAEAAARSVRMRTEPGPRESPSPRGGQFPPPARVAGTRGRFPRSRHRLGWLRFRRGNRGNQIGRSPLSAAAPGGQASETASCGLFAKQVRPRWNCFPRPADETETDAPEGAAVAPFGQRPKMFRIWPTRNRCTPDSGASCPSATAVPVCPDRRRSRQSGGASRRPVGQTSPRGQSASESHRNSDTRFEQPTQRKTQEARSRTRRRQGFTACVRPEPLHRVPAHTSSYGQLQSVSSGSGYT